MKNAKLLGIVGALVLVGAFAFLAYALTYTGTAGIDILQGTSGSDVMRGMGGPDTIYGNGQSDIIWGDCADSNAPTTFISCTTFAGHLFGDDTIYGGDGHDRIYGEDGSDTLFGGLGNDWIDGGLDADIIGDDNLNGWCDWGEEPGNDTLWGDYGVDLDFDPNGLNENDWICGGDGNDLIYGNDDVDILFGGRGINRISGNDATDTIWVDPLSTKDIINCGPGTDTVYLQGNTRAVWSTTGGPTFAGPYVQLWPIAIGTAVNTTDCEFIWP